MGKFRKIIIFLLFAGMITPHMVRCQDVVFAPPDSEWKNEGFWESPCFETSMDTRIEWVAYPHPTANEPLFAFDMLNEDELIIDTREGLSGMGFVDVPMKVKIRVTDLDQIGAWEIRLFYLKSPPLTSQDPLTTTNTDAPTTTIEGERVTVTRVVTIAVFETLPPERYLVPFSYILLGALGMLSAFVGGILVLILKEIDITFGRRIKEEQEE